MTDEKIENQIILLQEFLSTTIDSDYIYVDVPLYKNIGDWLIALGAWELLKSVPYNCLGKLRWEDYEYTKIAKDTIIVLQGGGNFGDLWRGATEARNEVIERYPNNKIVILSQTITYTDETLLRKDAAIYAKHTNLHICARDKESYEIAIKYFKANHVHLLPDTSVGLYPVLLKFKEGKTGRTLIINRRDKETDELFTDNGDVKEWDDILRDIHYNVIFAPYRMIRKVRKITKLLTLYQLENRYALHVLYSYVRKRIPQYFMQYDSVKTTRLHGYLLASMMHIPVEVKDNKYNKTTNYINTWMQ